MSSMRLTLHLQVMIPISERDVSIWDVDTHGWVPVKGQFKVYIGSSSRDIRLIGAFDYA